MSYHFFSTSASVAILSRQWTFPVSGTMGHTLPTSRCAHVTCYQLVKSILNEVDLGDKTYAFNLLVFNDLHGLTFACKVLDDGTCFCDYPSELVVRGQCAVSGDDVLEVRQVLLSAICSISNSGNYLKSGSDLVLLRGLSVGCR